jgi:hypothetical protein
VTGTRPVSRSLGSVTVTNYSQREHGDPDVQVGFTHEGQQITGFIDARRQNDGIWEAWVWFSYVENGWRATRKDWIPMDDLTVLTIDDEPVTPPSQPGGHLEQPDGPPADD